LIFFHCYIPYAVRLFIVTFSLLGKRKSNKKRNFFERLGVSMTSVIEEGCAPSIAETFEKVSSKLS